MPRAEKLCAIADFGGSKLYERHPSLAARTAVYNGTCADAEGAEMRVERRPDGTATVTVNVYNPDTGDWSRMATFALNGPHGQHHEGG